MDYSIPLDVEFFDSEDFNLLDDDGTFEEFCLSMDLPPIETSEPVEADKSTISDLTTKSRKAKKRKYGTLKKNETDSPISSISSNSGPSFSDDSEPSFDILGRKKVTTTKASKVTVFGENDVRAKYGDMFCEAFNDFDKISFAQLVRDYCEEELVVIYEYVGINPYGTPNYIEVRGFDTVVVFWDGLLTAIPDSLFQVHNTKYKVLPNGYTSIVCTFSFVGTKVYELAGLSEENKEHNCVVSAEEQSAAGGAPSPEKQQIKVTAYKAGSESECSSLTDTAAMGNGKKILQHKEEGNEQSFAVERSQLISKKVTVIGTLTYYVNPSKKIYQMSFVHSMKQ